MNITNNYLKKIGVAIAGGLVIVCGLALLVLPGPGILVILLGLGLLSSEFPWAKRWLSVLRRHASIKSK